MPEPHPNALEPSAANVVAWEISVVKVEKVRISGSGMWKRLLATRELALFSRLDLTLH